MIVLAALTQLTNIFVFSGFAWESKALFLEGGDNGGRGTRDFRVVLTAPATLWSGRCLQLQRSTPVNDFFLKTARVLLRRASRTVIKSFVKYTATEEITTMTVSSSSS